MTPPPPEPPSRAEAVLPLLALVCVLLGVCAPPLLLLGVVLGIVSLVKRREPASARGKTAAIASLVVGLVIIPLLAMGVFVPRVFKFKRSAKQAECKANLRAALMAERAYFEAHQAYSSSPSELGLALDRPRYLYLLDRHRPLSEAGLVPGVATASTAEQLKDAIPPALLARVGVTGTCPDCVLTLVCAGNLDEDPVVDVWSISTAERTAADGEVIRAGIPYNDVSDLDD
jgi:type II secretory pathway pseudopilin PulG